MPTTVTEAVATAKAAGYTDAERWTLDGMRAAWSTRYYDPAHNWAFVPNHNGRACIVLMQDGETYPWRLHSAAQPLPDPNAA